MRRSFCCSMTAGLAVFVKEQDVLKQTQRFDCNCLSYEIVVGTCRILNDGKLFLLRMLKDKPLSRKVFQGFSRQLFTLKFLVLCNM